MPPSERSSFSRSRVQVQAFLFGQTLRAGVQRFLDRAQALDRIRNRLPVGQRAAEPTVVDVVLGAALGCVGDRLRRLALGADEQHAAALGDDVANRLQRLVQQRHRLRQVDDVNLVARPVKVLRHARDSSDASGARNARQLPRADAWNSQVKPSGFVSP